MNACMCLYADIWSKRATQFALIQKSIAQNPSHTHHDTEVIDNEEIKKLKDDFRVVRPICGLCRLTKPIKTKDYRKPRKRSEV